MSDINSTIEESLVSDILDFWFGPLTAAGDTAENRQKLWFRGGASTDGEIKARFGDLLVQANNGQLDQWAGTARGRLALIVLLDQFSRNIYRGSGLAFSGDERARILCYEGLDNGHYEALPWIHRVFFLMPLEHGEGENHQRKMIEQLQALLEEVPEILKTETAGFLTFANQHAAVINQFGRFPHRNKALDRESTPEEALWLANGAKRWGQ